MVRGSWAGTLYVNVVDLCDLRKWLGTPTLILLSAKDWILMTRLSRSEKVDDMSAEGAFGGKEREKKCY